MNNSTAVKPQRIQRKRVKGYDMQAESLALNGLPAVSVCRPGRWGNPCKASEWDEDYRESMNEFKEVNHRAKWCNGRAVEAFEQMLSEGLLPQITENLHELRGKNLACFCALDCACHADVLLEIANKPEPGGTNDGN